MTYSKCIAAFNELLDYNAYFRMELGYTRTTGWTLILGNSNTGLITKICEVGASRPKLLWTQAASVLAKLKATYVNPDGTPNWTMQNVKNSLLSICPADRLNKLCNIKEEGNLLQFSAQGLDFVLDISSPNLEEFKLFIAKLV